MILTDFASLRQAIEELGISEFDRELEKSLRDGTLEGTDRDITNLVLGDYGIYHLEQGRLAKVIVHITDIGKIWIERHTEALIHLENNQYDRPGLIAALHKYHFTNCQTLARMFRQQRGNRYYQAQRQDGRFQYAILDNNQVIFTTANQKLYACRSCLTSLTDLTREEYDVTTFLPEKIFDPAVFAPAPIIDGNHPPACTAVPNLYTGDWNKIAEKAKEQANWHCEKCRLDLSADRQYLHCHHIDAMHPNNLITNLKVLCIACHADQPGHQQLTNAPGYSRFVAEHRPDPEN